MLNMHLKNDVCKIFNWYCVYKTVVLQQSVFAFSLETASFRSGSQIMYLFGIIVFVFVSSQSL